MAKKARLTAEQIAHFEPISALSRARLEELVTLAYIERVGLGVSVFREGDVDNQTVYLLAGDVQLTSTDGGVDKVLSASSTQASYPLDDSQPRQMSCVANGPIELLRIDNSVLDYMMMWDQLTIAEPATNSVSEVEVVPQVENTAKTKPETAAPDESNNAALKNHAAMHSDSTDAKVEQTAKVTPDNAPSTSAQNVAATDAERALKAKMKSEQREMPPPAKEKSTAAVAAAAPSHSKPEQAESLQPKQDTASAEQTESLKSDATETEPGAWMRRMHHIMAFKNMPPANIRVLLDRMEQVPVKAGDTIVQQGEIGDYYYVLTDGHAKVTRTVELAELKPGASFGEESLVSGVERNASVTMLSDGIMMRLAKEDFNELLKEPMLCRMSPDEARVNAAKGDVWLDVRHASEYHHAQLRKAINIPLHELRSRLAELEKSKRYICYCNTGRRSSAAAFLLVQNGFNACVLNGGVRVIPQDLQKGDRLI